jgi:hypothetical protein
MVEAKEESATTGTRPEHGLDNENPGPKYRPTPLSGSDRRALARELTKTRAMTRILADRANEKRAAGEALIREADDLACQSWNERMWADGGPIDPSPTIDQAINGGLMPGSKMHIG